MAAAAPEASSLHPSAKEEEELLRPGKQHSIPCQRDISSEFLALPSPVIMSYSYLGEKDPPTRLGCVTRLPLQCTIGGGTQPPPPSYLPPKE